MGQGHDVTRPCAAGNGWLFLQDSAPAWHRPFSPSAVHDPVHVPASCPASFPASCPASFPASSRCGGGGARRWGGDSGVAGPCLTASPSPRTQRSGDPGPTRSAACRSLEEARRGDPIPASAALRPSAPGSRSARPG
ncbi:hypothetical protein SL003B_2603 [Polymorphum gilvum SL003B-26A1]|uniref:Uncharacterized protein n=1 Tax=Polymorphum gilvum (strain LMG 25793 / CGMCC 1.9160 / SL003B-26A1) TaxID=991905 RepID=F2J3K3_POLGS|nr:hypothetical protein SL003B_2603 [Polymorphum gilvum SL003B-26A1]